MIDPDAPCPICEGKGYFDEEVDEGNWDGCRDCVATGRQFRTRQAVALAQRLQRGEQWPDPLPTDWWMMDEDERRVFERLREGQP